MLNRAQVIAKNTYSMAGGLYYSLKHATGCIIDGKRKKPFVETYNNIRSFGFELLDFMNINVEVDGLENMIPGPGIVVQNHSSSLDIPTMSFIPGRQYFGAKKELFKLPIFGSGMRYGGMIEVDRSSVRTAIDNINKGMDWIKLESLDMKPEDSAYMILFPEGTRDDANSNYDLQRFQKGAFDLALKKDVPIIPVASHGAFELMPKGQLFANKGTIHLEILPAILPEDYSFSIENLDEKAIRDQRKIALVDMMSDTQRTMQLALHHMVAEYSKR